MNATPTKQVSSDADLREVIESLGEDEKRQLGMLLVENVMFLSEDPHVEKAVRLAQDETVDAEDRAAANKALKRAMIDSRTRCGADSDWNEQAEHFVIRAAMSVVAPDLLPPTRNPLWQVIQSCRMARASALVAADDDSDNPEPSSQYEIVNDFLGDQS